MFSPIFSGFPGSLRFSQVSSASAGFFFFASIVAEDKCEAPRPQMLVYSCLEGRK